MAENKKEFVLISIPRSAAAGDSLLLSKRNFAACHPTRYVLALVKQNCVACIASVRDVDALSTCANPRIHLWCASLFRGNGGTGHIHKFLRFFAFELLGFLPTHSWKKEVHLVCNPPRFHHLPVWPNWFVFKKTGIRNRHQWNIVLLYYPGLHPGVENQNEVKISYS